MGKVTYEMYIMRDAETKSTPGNYEHLWLWGLGLLGLMVLLML